MISWNRTKIIKIFHPANNTHHWIHGKIYVITHIVTVKLFLSTMPTWEMVIGNRRTGLRRYNWPQTQTTYINKHQRSWVCLYQPSINFYFFCVMLPVDSLQWRPSAAGSNARSLRINFYFYTSFLGVAVDRLKKKKIIFYNVAFGHEIPLSP